MAVQQRIGRINSGDVSLFYSAFGSPGATPFPRGTPRVTVAIAATG